MRGISCATSAARSGSTSSCPVKRRCRADAPGASEIMIGSIATKATSPRGASSCFPPWPPALARHQRLRVQQPAPNGVEPAPAERQRGEKPDHQPFAAPLRTVGRAGRSGLHDSGHFGAPVARSSRFDRS